MNCSAFAIAMAVAVAVVAGAAVALAVYGRGSEREAFNINSANLKALRAAQNALAEIQKAQKAHNSRAPAARSLALGPAIAPTGSSTGRASTPATTTSTATPPPAQPPKPAPGEALAAAWSKCVSGKDHGACLAAAVEYKAFANSADKSKVSKEHLDVINAMRSAVTALKMTPLVPPQKIS